MSTLTFADLNLPADLFGAVADMGFVTPTPVQEQAIPALLAGNDVVGIAQTGTGKTAAFGLPLLAAIDSTPGVQALVLAPTRELAQQSSRAMTDFARHLDGVKIVSVYGGAPYGPQISALRHGAQVVVGTPGRVIDLIEKGELHMEGVRFFVLDEADEMLRMGFAEDVETISATIAPTARKALFSATMPPTIKKVADTYLREPVRIEITPQASTVDTVDQMYAVVPFAYKQEALARILATTGAQAAIVFVRTRADAEEVATSLQAAHLRAAALSGDVAQTERERIIARLRNAQLDILVATDVAARGLDVERIGLVVNYDVPREAEAYVHRIGRTGRAGRSGSALTFFTPKEHYRLKKIERLTGSAMRCITVPSTDDVAKHQAQAALQAALGRLKGGGLDVYREAVAGLADDHDALDIATALLALACEARGRIRAAGSLGRVRREVELDEAGNFISASFEGGREKAPRKGGRERGGRKDSRMRQRQASRPPMSGARAYRIEVGRRDGVRPGAIVGAITNEGGVAGSDLGSITIFPSFSLVEIAGLSQAAAKKIGQARVAGRRLRIREDAGPAGKRHEGGRGPRKHHRRDDWD